VTITETANVTGNVYSPKVSLVEGARFRGSIDMDYVASSSEKPKTAPAASADSEQSPPKAAAGAA